MKLEEMQKFDDTIKDKVNKLTNKIVTPNNLIIFLLERNRERKVRNDKKYEARNGRRLAIRLSSLWNDENWEWRFRKENQKDNQTL